MPPKLSLPSPPYLLDSGAGTVLHYLGQHLLLYWVIPTQCASRPCTSDDRAPSEWNSEIHSFGLWTPNSPDVNPVDYQIWAWCRMKCIRRQFKMWPIWDRAWSTHGIACRKALWTMPLTNEWMNEWKNENARTLSAFEKPTESWLCLTHYVNKSSHWAK